MKRVEALQGRWKGYKERRAKAGFTAIPTCEYPIAPHERNLIFHPIKKLDSKRSDVWKRVFDAHHPQEPLGQTITEG